MAYTYFANYYDRLTGNVSYPERARYFDTIMKQNTDHVELLLDLACGTGSLSAELVNLGYDVIGVDSSAEMLSFAASKAPGALFLCQDMTSLNLYGTIDVTICALDSLNHMIEEQELQRAFDRVAMFTAPSGLFIFDVNTVYKHRAVLGCNTFFYENEDCCCVWQNEYNEHHHIVTIDLDFFVKEGENYRRESENFCERAYTPEELDGFIKAAGLETIAVYGDDTLDAPTETTQRLIYVTRKLPVERGGIAANNTKSIRIRRKTRL
ncbi:class I SAM-dependent methyltransferase [Hydrogenoanaerobacterium sp.]|uniref:class I SAM-dependent DNA methyltransferase n=1 Tax=Hydrogenoanaerobacterium sp. TaxID=2953763 RepID=UPI00289C3BCB|nr:class I SAM-dependent methyltransferase [Hydrogenoanaerobacterium sp.]